MGGFWDGASPPEEAIAYHVRDDAKVKAQQRPMGCLIICLVAEKGAAELGDKRWAVTLPMLFEFVGNRDVKSTENSCKM